MFFAIFLLSHLALFLGNAQGASWSDCSGKRIDSLGYRNNMTGSACIKLGGNCCSIFLNGGHPYGSDDPKTMSAKSPCYACYNTKVKSFCTGKLARTKITSEANWWVTSQYCIKRGGTCCDAKTMHLTRQSSPSVFDPQKYPTEAMCNNCYKGNVTTSAGKQSCSGKLVATVEYTSATCSYFGGKCCDNDATTSNPSSGGSAFSPAKYLYESCENCFSGSLAG